MHEYTGHCGCGATRVILRSRLAPEEFQPRSDAPNCAFCRQHQGVWISDPRGSLVIDKRNVTTIERFASEQVTYHFCAKCHELAYAICADASAAKHVAVVRRDLFEPIAVAAKPVLVTNFEGATISEARKRRFETWTLVASNKLN